MGATNTWATKVSPELDQKVRAVADSMGINKQELVRFVVAQYVDNQLAMKMASIEMLKAMLDKGLEDAKMVAKQPWEV